MVGIPHIHSIGGVTQTTVSYVRDGVGSPTSATWTNGNTQWTVNYQYIDPLNRLTQENHSIRGTRNWTYDWVGNRLDTGFVYNAQTDWLSEGPSQVIRQYTGAGSMEDRDGVSYTYNPQELLAGVGASTTMAWDAESRRVSLNVGNDAYTFVYDPTASIPAVVQEFGPNGRSIIYAREPNGSLIARVDLNQLRVYFHYFDALGSTVLVANNRGQVDRYDYGAWGETYHLAGTTTDNPYQYVGELGYYTHWQSPDLANMLHLGVRFYEPEVGRPTFADWMNGRGDNHDFRYNPAVRKYTPGLPA